MVCTLVDDGVAATAGHAGVVVGGGDACLGVAGAHGLVKRRPTTTLAPAPIQPLPQCRCLCRSTYLDISDGSTHASLCFSGFVCAHLTLNVTSEDVESAFAPRAQSFLQCHLHKVLVAALPGSPSERSKGWLSNEIACKLGNGSLPWFLRCISGRWAGVHVCVCACVRVRVHVWRVGW